MKQPLLPRVSASNVYKAALRETDSGSRARCHLRIWGPVTSAHCCWAFSAFNEAAPTAVVNHSGDGHAPGQAPPRRYMVSEQRTQRAVHGSRHAPHSQSRGHIPKGLRPRGMARGTKCVRWNEPPASPETPGRHLHDKAECSDVHSQAHQRVCDGRAACGTTCQQAHLGHHLPWRARAPVANSC